MILTSILDRNKDDKVDVNDFYTGNESRQLLVHVMQNGIEVDKPIKTKIWKQQVEWRQRVFPIQPSKFVRDYKGLHHLYVNANDMAVLSFNKDHEDKCRKCGGKMSIDARNARDLVKRKTIEAIWGIDSTHIILLIILGMGMLISVFAVIYFANQVTALQNKINSAVATGDLAPLTSKFILGGLGIVT